MAVASLKSRQDFLRLRYSPYKWVTPGFIVQVAAMPLQPDTGGDSCRVGFVVTKKMGKATVRNRIKRRLRAAVRAVFPLQAKPGFDYVLIARPIAVTRPYEELTADLTKAVQGTHRKMFEKQGDKVC